MWVLDPRGGYPGKTRFLRETLGESVPVGPRIGVLGHPAALRWAIWVSCRVGGYPASTPQAKDSELAVFRC